MIIVLKSLATDAERVAIVERIEELGLRAHVSTGEERTIIGVVGNDRAVDPSAFESLPGVERTIPILRPFKLVSRDFKPEPTCITLGNGVTIGGEAITVIAGPCAVESREQLLTTAKAVRSAGAHLLRGGAFKPRSSPYSFQGMGEEGLAILAEAKSETGLGIVTELMSESEIDTVARYADVIQIGARNMQNFSLLKEVGRLRKPVLIKRGMSSTLEELCLAAEHVMSQGNRDVMLCERGIRTFERATRNTLDLSAVAVLKEWTHLPVLVDPSHGTGKRSLVTSMSLAAIAAGADGLIIEVHPHPDRALSDGPQSLAFDQFHSLMQQMRALVAVVGRKL